MPCGRTDKPLVTGALPVRWVRTACALAVVATVSALPRAAEWARAPVHLASVAAGWAYNLGLKRTWWSWLPYAVAFGALPAFVSLAGPDGEAPPWWWPVAGALLGVGAHLLNVLPDLADDAETGRARLSRTGSDPGGSPASPPPSCSAPRRSSWWAPASRSRWAWGPAWCSWRWEAWW